MRCEWASELMSLGLDGQPHDEAGLEAHLATCQACRQRWSALRMVERLLAYPPIAQPPADFTTRVMARVAQRSATNPWRALGGWTVLFIGAVMLGLVGFSPLALALWTVAQQPQFDATATLVGWLFQLGSLGTVLLHLIATVLGLIPPPVYVLFMLTALTLATAWVAIVGHLHVERYTGTQVYR